MKFEIKSRWSGSVLFECEAVSLKIVMEKAVEARANLKGAYLKGAYLKGADLEGADLEGAYLKGAYLKGAYLKGAYLKGAYLEGANLEGAYLEGANLKGADLEGAYLKGAYLKGADLKGAYLKGAYLEGANLEGADLEGANLKGANLEGADLEGANLEDIKADFFSRLDLAKDEVVELYDALKRGRVNGSAYEGECACFVGTIANIRKEHYENLSVPLKPDAGSPTERWFLAIQRGDVPENSVVSKITCEWVEEWLKKNKNPIPQYKLVSSLERPELFG